MVQKYSPLLKNYDVPRGKISMCDLEKLLHQRLLVLILVEKIDNSSSMNTEEKIEKLLDVVQHHELHLYSYLLTRNGRPPETKKDFEYLEQEKVAHVFLNGIFSTWKEPAKMIRKQEITLFEWQIFNYKTRRVIDFMSENKIDFLKATKGEKENLRNKLEMFREDDDVRTLEDTVIYKVPWQQAVNLGGSRKVAHHLGVSFIPDDKMKGILTTIYKEHLRNERKNNVYETAITHGLDSLRVNQLRGFLFYFYSCKIREFRKSPIKMSQIDKYIDSFPPCARIIHEELEHKYHLKFNTRRQYWLFLKGIGAQATEVSDYIRHYFVDQGMMEPATYREHHYFILLLFGLVGSRIDYQTPNCASNIEDSRGIGEVNGCPFGNPGQVDIEDLEKILTKWKISETERQEILEHRKNGDCSRACSAYFKGVHEKPPNIEITNPLDFFTESQHIINKRTNAIPEENSVEEENINHLDEQLKSPYPRYPDVFSKQLKAKIQETMISLTKDEETKEVEVQQVLKEAEIPEVKVNGPIGTKRVSLMKKPSASLRKPSEAGSSLVEEDQSVLQSKRPTSPIKETSTASELQNVIARETVMEQSRQTSESEKAELPKVKVNVPIGTKSVSLMKKASASVQRPSEAESGLLKEVRPVLQLKRPASPIEETSKTSELEHVIEKEALVKPPRQTSESIKADAPEAKVNVLSGTKRVSLMKKPSTAVGKPAGAKSSLVKKDQPVLQLKRPASPIKETSIASELQNVISREAVTELPRQTSEFKKAEVSEVKVTVPVGTKRVSLMKKPSASVQKPSEAESSLLKDVRPVLQLKRPASPIKETSKTSELEVVIGEEAVMNQPRQTSESKKASAEQPMIKAASVVVKPKMKLHDEILIEQAHSALEPSLCPEGKAVLERVCLTLNPKVPVTIERLIDETLLLLHEDREMQPEELDAQPNLQLMEAGTSVEKPKKDRTKGWKKRKRLIASKRRGGGENPFVVENHEQALAIFTKNIAKMSFPIDSGAQQPSGECSTRKRKRSDKNNK